MNLLSDTGWLDHVEGITRTLEFEREPTPEDVHAVVFDGLAEEYTAVQVGRRVILVARVDVPAPAPVPQAAERRPWWRFWR